MAGEYLYANRASFPYEWRKTAARNILKEALRYDDLAERGVKLAGAVLGGTRFEPATMEYLERAAGFGMTHPLKAAEKCAQRAYMLRGNFKDYAEKMAEIAVSLREMEVASPAQMQKLAAVVDLVDRETGLCNHYHEGVDLPEEMFFDVLEKEAAAMLDSFVTLTTGNSYPVGAFASLPLEKIAAVMGSEFSDAVKSVDGLTVDAAKFAEIAPTLPRNDAALLERALEEAINVPQQKMAQATVDSAFGITKEARGGKFGDPSLFSKDSMAAKFKSMGKKVEDADYTLSINLA
jgi:hypothetical protein